MLRSWSRSPWRADDDAEAGRMLDLQIRLGNVERIDAFLAELSAEGHYAASDNGAIVRAAALLPPPRATDLLVRIVRRNAPAHLSACGDLLLRCVAAPTGATGDLEQIGVALIEALPGGPTRPGAGRHLDSADAREAGLRRRSPDGDKPDRCGARGARDRAPAGLAEDIQAGRRAGPGCSGACQAGGEHGLAGGRAAPRGVSRPSAQAHRPAAGGATGLDQDQPAQMHMWRLPCTGRVPGRRRINSNGA